MVDRISRWAGELGLEMEQPGAPAEVATVMEPVMATGRKAAGGRVWSVRAIRMDAASCLFVHLTSF